MPTVANRIIEDAKDLLITALDCIYSCPRTDQLNVMSEIFMVLVILFNLITFGNHLLTFMQCLPERDENMDKEDKQYHELQNRVDQFEEHLSIDETLQK